MFEAGLQRPPVSSCRVICWHFIRWIGLVFEVNVMLGRVFLFTPLIIATSRGANSGYSPVTFWLIVIILRTPQYDWLSQYGALYNTRDAAFRMIYPVMERVSKVQVGGGGRERALCELWAEVYPRKTISALCYPIMRTKDQHSHQITLSPPTENKTHPDSGNNLTRLLTNFKLG